MNINRRDLLRLAAASCATPFITRNEALGADFWSMPRSLHLQRGRELVRATYWADGKLQPQGYTQICHIMRDVQANVTVQMDIVLLDILRGMQGWFELHGQSRVLHLTSGYRTPGTNSKEGGALNSWHMKAAAVDLYVPDVPVEYMAKLALYFGQGGVGIYRKRNFLHVDRGNLRAWIG